MNYSEEMNEKILQGTPAELKEIAENMQYEVLQHMSTKAQSMIFNALK